MDSDDVKWLLGVLAIITIVVGGMFYGVNALTRASCTAAWAHSGMATSYSIMGGCQLHLSDGKWIPADSYFENTQRNSAEGN